MKLTIFRPLRLGDGDWQELAAARDIEAVRFQVTRDCAKVESLVRECFKLAVPTPENPGRVRVRAAVFN